MLMDREWLRIFMTANANFFNNRRWCFVASTSSADDKIALTALIYEWKGKNVFPQLRAARWCLQVVESVFRLRDDFKSNKNIFPFIRF